MLEQREKVCKVCKAADNRGLPSRSAEHGSVEWVHSPMIQDKQLGSKCKHARAWVESIFQENPLVWYIS